RLSRIAILFSPATHLDSEPATEGFEEMITETIRTQSEDNSTQPANNSRRCFLKVSSVLSLAVAFRPRTIAEAFAYSKARTAPGTEQVADKAAIRPFQFNFTDAELTDLR